MNRAKHSQDRIHTYDIRFWSRLGYLTYPFQRLRRVPDCYITCAGKTDGAGAQIQAVMSVMLFASQMGITYVHTPFRSIAHAPPDIPDWAAHWERLVNLGADELPRPEIEKRVTRIRILKHPAQLWKQRSTLNVIAHCHSYADRFPCAYESIVERLRNKCQRSSMWQFLGKNRAGPLAVEVHVRRGDVTSDGKHSGRYTTNQEVREDIRIARTAAVAAGLPLPLVTIHSEGSAADFQEFTNDGVRLNLNEDPTITFQRLIAADILVMAKSSFSYAAALLSRGLVLYRPFLHSPLPHWIDVSWPSIKCVSLLEQQLLEMRMERPAPPECP